MELNNTFEVAASAERAWEVLTDAERVAPCLPGATLTGIQNDDLLGKVKVKVGPIRVQYDGAARFVETDRDARRIVLRGEGRDSRGQGTASATISLALSPGGESTTVDVHTDLQVTGKVAQFGRNVLADVSDRLIAQFAQNLEREVAGSDGAGLDGSGSDGSGSDGAGSDGAGSDDAGSGSAGSDGAGSGSAGSDAGPNVGRAGGSPLEAPPEQARGSAVSTDGDSYLDLMDAAGGVLARRALPYAAVLVAVVLAWLLGRRGGTGRSPKSW